jgi:hypothetical protein
MLPKGPLPLVALPLRHRVLVVPVVNEFRGDEKGFRF